MSERMKKVHVTIEIVAEENCIEGLVSDMVADAACMDGVEGVRVVGKTEVGNDNQEAE